MKLRLQQFLAFSSLCFCLFSCNKASEQPKETQASLSAQYDSIIQQGIDRDFPGIILAIQAKDQTPWVGAAGLSSIEEKAAMKREDRFHTASITKLFTSIVTLQLIDQGQLNFDDLAINFLDPNLGNKIPNMDRINIGHLLDHSSGIYSFNNDLDYLNTILGEKASDNISWSSQDLLELCYADRVEAEGEPGSGNYYSDANLILLALIIEQVTKKPFRQVVKENILDPLELTNTGFYSEKPDSDKLSMTTTVQGYIKRSDILDEFITIDPSFQEAAPGLLNTSKAAERIDAAAGIVSNAQDLITLGAALYHGDLVSEESLAWLLSIGEHIEKEEFNSQKQGIVSVRNKNYGVLFTSLGDGTGGMNTMLAYHPKSELIIVAYTNIFGNFDEHDFFIDSIVPAVVLAGEREYK